jgi:hypothetical protein
MSLVKTQWKQQNTLRLKNTTNKFFNTAHSTPVHSQLHHHTHTTTHHDSSTVQYSKAKMSQVVKAPIRMALRNLHTQGIKALQAQPITDPTSSRQRWKGPIVSRRVAKDLRKKAIREGTYGTYDALEGIGWDEAWDVGLFKDNSSVGKINWMEVRGFKETKRERTRESRAKRIEALLDGADDKIMQFRQKKRDDKPEGGISNVIKQMIKGSTK